MARLLVLQVAYLLFALGYNVVSYALQRQTGIGLAATDPIFGFLAVAAIVGPCVITGFLGWMRVHAVYAVLVATLFCFGGGVLPHLTNFIVGDLNAYRGLGALVAAAGINLFGAVIFLFSGLTAWRGSPP